MHWRRMRKAQATGKLLQAALRYDSYGDTAALLVQHCTQSRCRD